MYEVREYGTDSFMIYNSETEEYVYSLWFDSKEEAISKCNKLNSQRLEVTYEIRYRPDRCLVFTKEFLGAMEYLCWREEQENITVTRIRTIFFPLTWTVNI